MKKSPESLIKKLGLKFAQPELFVMALTHRSMGAKNNERLEYLGDSILGFVVAETLYEQFPNASEGELSRLRASLVNQSSLASLARELKLGEYLILGSGELKSGGYRRDSILSDAMEAIMGALLKDQGVEACKNWILQLFAEKLSQLDLNKSQKDPKTQLQELMQARKIKLPAYDLLSMSGAAHAQTFKVKCVIDLEGEQISTGTGESRKKAEQDAAAKMLEIIKKKLK